MNIFKKIIHTIIKTSKGEYKMSRREEKKAKKTKACSGKATSSETQDSASSSTKGCSGPRKCK